MDGGSGFWCISCGSDWVVEKGAKSGYRKTGSSTIESGNPNSVVVKYCFACHPERFSLLGRLTESLNMLGVRLWWIGFEVRNWKIFLLKGENSVS